MRAVVQNAAGGIAHLDLDRNAVAHALGDDAEVLELAEQAIELVVVGGRAGQVDLDIDLDRKSVV